MEQNLNNKKLVKIIKEYIKDNIYDYLVNWNDEKYSIVHIIDNYKDMNKELKGWHLWIIINADEDDELIILKNECLFIQTVANEQGFIDYHILSNEEVNNFMKFFLNGIMK